MPHGGEAWLITRYEDVRAVLADPRFSSDRRKPGFPRIHPAVIAAQDHGVPARPNMIGLDGAEHAANRRPVLSEFTVKRVRAMRPRIQTIVDEHIDAMLAAGSPADLVTSLSLPVPSLVICELLGVPYADHEFFQSCTAELLSFSTTGGGRADAMNRMLAYMDRLCAAKEADPGDDLLGRVITKQRTAGDGTDDHEHLVGLAVILLVAGHETTANVISLGTAALLNDPALAAPLRSGTGSTPALVEELVRYFSITGAVTSRAATEDTTIGGTPIRAGEGVVALVPAANHDPDAFDSPDRIDPERGSRHHLGFGYGVHQCLGQNLARLELEIVFDTLFRRIPTLRLDAPLDTLPFKDDAAIYGLNELPVAW
jgi:cytochrome P450